MNPVRRWLSIFVDQVISRVALYVFMRYRRTRPLVGTTRFKFPALMEGDVEAFHRPVPPAVRLEDYEHRVDESGHQLIHELAFPSIIRTGFRENDLVHCSRWKPNGNDRGLTVLGCEGLVQLTPDWFRWMADVLTPEGVEVFMMDPSFNYRRTPKGYLPGQLILGGDLDHQLAVARQCVLDLVACVKSLKAEGRRVGLVGCSYGGWMVLQAAILCDEIDFVVSLVPSVDYFAQLQCPGPITTAVEHGLAASPELRPLLEKATRSIRPNLWMPKKPGLPVVIHQASDDHFVPLGPQQEIADKWGAVLIKHPGAHYPLAINPAIWQEVARDTLTLWGGVTPLRAEPRRDGA